MIKKKPKILFISSANPLIGPARLALDYTKAMKEYGLEVDLLTLNPVESHPDILYVQDSINSIIKRKYVGLKDRILKRYPREGYYFFYRKENFPPVASSAVLKKITKQYDIVYILFWQGMLSFETVEKIYDKLHCQIHFRCVDYSPMSGGCHFTCNCERYKIGCGKCPAFNSNDENDFTRWNVKYRQRVYDKVNPIVYGNTYMQQFYNESFLLKSVRKVKCLPLIDETIYYPHDKIKLRTKYNIPSEVNFIIFFGCQSLDDPRKGMNLLLKSLRLFYEKVKENSKEILLLIAGRNYNLISDKLNFKSVNLGFLPYDTLPEMYSLADVYLSPSIHDAGPSMVNQSISCGTPVVSFEMGTALDVIKGQGTGYCAKLGDAEDFANGIYQIFKEDKLKSQEIKNNCLEFANKHTSKAAFVQQMLNVYSKYGS